MKHADAPHMLKCPKRLWCRSRCIRSSHLSCTTHMRNIRRGAQLRCSRCSSILRITRSYIHRHRIRSRIRSRIRNRIRNRIRTGRSNRVSDRQRTRNNDVLLYLNFNPRRPSSSEVPRPVKVAKHNLLALALDRLHLFPRAIVRRVLVVRRLRL